MIKHAHCSTSSMNNNDNGITNAAAHYKGPTEVTDSHIHMPQKWTSNI